MKKGPGPTLFSKKDNLGSAEGLNELHTFLCQ